MTQSGLMSTRKVQW